MTELTESPPIAPRRVRPWWPVALLLAIVALRFLIVSPAFDPMALWSSGRFLYGGQQLLHGAVLYRDVWAPLPPMMFIINAAGLGSLWGIWLVEFLSLVATALLSYALMRRAFGPFAAFFGTLCWILGLSLTLRGNEVEEYGLLFQFATLYAFARAEARLRPSIFSFVTGILIGLTFFLRQDLIAVGVGIVVYLALQVALRRKRFADARLMAIVIGALGVGLVAVLYFVVTGALPAMWDAVFRYNAIYDSVTLAGRLDQVLLAVEVFSHAGLPLIVVTAWTVGVAAAVSGRLPRGRSRRLVAVALIALPIQILLSTLTGDPATNYGVPWLAPAGLLAAYFASLLLAAGKASSRPARTAVPANVWLIALIVAISVLPLVETLAWARTALQRANADDRRFPTVAYLNENIPADATLLVWGAEPMLNVLSGRRSSSPFFEQSSLFVTRSPQVDERLISFARGLTAQPPAYILDTSANIDRIPPIDPQQRAEWQKNRGASASLPMDVELALLYLNQNYQAEMRFSTWILYRRIDYQPAPAS